LYAAFLISWGRSQVIQRFKDEARRLASLLLHERLDPSHAAAAVFTGIFIGIVPIYGFQTLAAIGLSLLFRLNKPLTVACTFISNPLFLPLIIFSSVELGCLLRRGHFQPMSLSTLIAMRNHLDKEQVLIWVIGSVALAILAGAIGAALTAVVIHRHRRFTANAALRERQQYVNEIFHQCGHSVRGFVRWKLRLDRIFELLTAEDLGSGMVVDLGCGYGIALCFAAFGNNRRRLIGCDFEEHRITVARKALAALNADLTVADIRSFEFSSAGLILIMDVLQCLSSAEQSALLKRCCSSLANDGVLIFRVHDRERGIRSAITMALEWLLFAREHKGLQPQILPMAEYRSVLETAGMHVEERHFRNHLPLAHVLFVARKPATEAGL
jgi:uncharacterized protein (DUF2062 family)/trans-aconitate methyltransferase